MGRQNLAVGVAVAALVVALLGNVTTYVIAKRDTAHAAEAARDARMNAQDLREQQDDLQTLTNRLRTLALENCSTINANTESVYGVALAFKALAEAFNDNFAKPGQKLEARVEQPEFLPCEDPAKE